MRIIGLALFVDLPGLGKTFVARNLTDVWILIVLGGLIMIEHFKLMLSQENGYCKKMKCRGIFVWHYVRIS